MTLSRQQRRQQARDLTRAGEALLKRGVPRAPRFADLLGLTWIFHSALRNARRQSAAVDCAELAQRAYQASVAADPPQEPVACRAGCAYCCHSVVMVTAPEAFRLAAEVARAAAGRPSARTDFMARAAVTAGLPPADRFGRKLACPLLVDGACSVYAARPLPCRRVTSFQVAPCIEEYEGQDGDILLPTRLLAHATHAHIPLLAAIRALGQTPRIYELSAAVKTILETDKAEARWLAGEDLRRKRDAHVQSRCGEVPNQRVHGARMPRDACASAPCDKNDTFGSFRGGRRGAQPSALYRAQLCCIGGRMA